MVSEPRAAPAPAQIPVPVSFSNYFRSSVPPLSDPAGYKVRRSVSSVQVRADPFAAGLEMGLIWPCQPIPVKV